MSNEINKLNLISIVQELKEEDINTIENYIKRLEKENQDLKKENKKLKSNWECLKEFVSLFGENDLYINNFRCKVFYSLILLEIKCLENEK